MKCLCRTCKNWERNSSSWGREKHGLCFSDKVHDSEDYRSRHLSRDSVVVHGDTVDVSWMETGELFGCIHHSPLPEGETK